METGLSELTDLYATGGLALVSALLTVAVVYLFKRFDSLYKEMITMKEGSFKDTKQAAIDCAVVARDASAAIVNCTSALERLSKAMDDLKDDMKEVKAKL